MTREQAEFVNKLCESNNVTWIKLHIEYQKQFIDSAYWHEDSSGYQKGTALPHGNQIDGSELCKEAQKILNKI